MRKLLVAALLCMAGAAKAQTLTTINENLWTTGNWQYFDTSINGASVFSGTVSVQGSAFSVGKSTLVVINGDVNISTNVDQGYPLAVNGALAIVGSTNTWDLLSAAISGSTTGDLYFQNRGPVSGAVNQMSIAPGGQVTVYNGPFIVQSGNVGIGTTSPAQALEVNGNAQFDGTTNISNVASVASSGGSATSASFSACIATATIVTHGGNVEILFNSDASNSTLADGCVLWILQDGAFFNSQSTTIGLNDATSATANAHFALSYSGFINSTPAAGTHKYCYGAGVVTGGTCTFGIQVNPTLQPIEFR